MPQVLVRARPEIPRENRGYIGKAVVAAVVAAAQQRIVIPLHHRDRKTGSELRNSRDLPTSRELVVLPEEVVERELVGITRREVMLQVERRQGARRKHPACCWVQNHLLSESRTLVHGLAVCVAQE